MIVLSVPLVLRAGENTDNIRNFISLSTDNPFLPIFLVIGVLIAILTFLFPRFGLIVMMVFMLISTDMQLDDTTQERSSSIRFEDIVLILVSIGWLFNRAKKRSLSLFRHVPINKSVLMMSCVIIVSTLIGYIAGTTPIKRGILYSLKRLEYFWLFFMALNILTSDREVKVAVKILLLLTGIIAVIGSVQFFLFPLSGLTQGGATATSGFGRANTLADFYLIAGGMFLGLFMYSQKKKDMLQYLFVTILCGGAIVMTKSRGAYVSVPPLLFTIFIVTRSRKFLISIFVVIGLFITYYTGMALLSTFNVDNDNAQELVQKHTGDIKNQFESLESIATEGVEADSSFYARYSSWVNNIDNILRRPLFGHGVGSVPLSFFDCHHVREIYETGFIGYTVFIWMNISIFFTVLRLFHMTNDFFIKGITSGFLGGHIAMLIHGWSIANFYTIMNMEVFWFVVAMLMILYSNHIKKIFEEEEEIPGAMTPRQMRT
jgi:hypothetical protein